MKKVSIGQVVDACGLRKEVEELREGGSESHFFSFRNDYSPLIVVEATASNFMEDLARLPAGSQAKIVGHLASLIPEPGDAIALSKEDGKRNSGAGRSALVTRLKSEGDYVSLLITR